MSIRPWLLNGKPTKTCLNCGDAYQPRDRDKPYAWNRRKYCGPKCVSQIAKCRPKPYSSEQFFGLLRQNGDCWEWPRARTPRGYGVCRADVDGVKRAHRVAYKMAFGAIPDGLFVCHHCDNPPCCNPAHLFVGTNADNLQDMRRKGRHARTINWGEASGTAKLRAAEVHAIRAAAGAHARIAAEFGVSRSLVQRIKQRLAWQYLPDEETLAA